MVEIERLCERVIFLSSGRVIANGTPSAIASQFERDDLEGVFIHLAQVGAEQRERDARRAQETDHTA
jgi:ABC-2 type transport system ATP-binding protein